MIAHVISLLLVSRCAATGSGFTAGSGSLGPLFPNPQCATDTGLYFDSRTQRCSNCIDLDREAIYDPNAFQGNGDSCTCSPGFVACRGGQQCFAGQAFMPDDERSLECRLCPVVDGRQTYPTQDRRRCLPCDSASTVNSSEVSPQEQQADCMCGPGRALIERGDDGAYLHAKKCVLCAENMFAGAAEEETGVYNCKHCPDEVRMYRDASTGECRCQNPQFVRAGDVCVEHSDATLVTERFPETEAVNVVFRDLIDGQESWWQCGPFGTHIGIELRTCDTIQALDLNVPRQIASVSSASIKWLYKRCGVECIRSNMTSCQCIANLCALMLYEDDATVCRFLRDLYQGRGTELKSQQAYGVRGMPWLFYTNQTPTAILQDTSVNWKFTLQNDGFGDSRITNKLSFWLARYALEGAWLGWERLGSQLDLCVQLGGTSTSALSPPSAWHRFGSSVLTECQVSFRALQRCGEQPILYELFVENIGGELAPVPVRILNLVRRGERPNLNRNSKDVEDDELVRRFVLCDAVTGIPGEATAYLSRSIQPVVFRWAAHMAMRVLLRSNVEGQIYVPVLSIAYAEKRTAHLGEDASTGVSFRPEYSMNTESYWEVMTWFVVLICLATVALASYRMYLYHLRYPSVPKVASVADPGLFAPKLVGHLILLFSSMTVLFFWFHVAAAMYWFALFKGQDIPKVLLPTAFEGDEYAPHDIFLVLVTCTGFICLCLDLFKHLKVVVVLIDWEQKLQPRASGYAWRTLHAKEQDRQKRQLDHQRQNLLSQAGEEGFIGEPEVPASPQAAAGKSLLQPGIAEAPDVGVSAWRSLFVCNELNERLVATRTTSYFTWGLMVLFLEGFGWKNGARWYPRFSGSEANLAAEFNPFLQFALGALVWMLVVAIELIVQRVLSIQFGDGLNDFVDVCSVANISVLFLDEPFHGYYIHGKAPSNRGDWSHSELCKVLGDEDRGIGFSRGLTNRSIGVGVTGQPEDCQTFEAFLPPDLSVQIPEHGPVHFRTELIQIFADVRQIQATIASRSPERARSEDLVQLARCRCDLQVMGDALINAVLQAMDEVVLSRETIDWFWGVPPAGGVRELQQPVFFRDQEGPASPNGIAWSSALAYGHELRLLGIGLPTGFEWHLILMEFMVFSLTWRFHGSVYLAVGLAFCFNEVVLRSYSAIGRMRLASTALINDMFLI